MPADDLSGRAVMEEDCLHLVGLYLTAAEVGAGLLAARLRATAGFPAGD